MEGGLLDQIVEVYELADISGNLEAPIHIIETGCRGLNAIDYSQHMIYLGFMGTITESNNMV